MKMSVRFRPLLGDPVAERARLIRRHPGVGQHRVLAPVDQRAGLGREPLWLSVRKHTVLWRRLVDEDVVVEVPARAARYLGSDFASCVGGGHINLGGLRCGTKISLSAARRTRVRPGVCPSPTARDRLVGGLEPGNARRLPLTYQWLASVCRNSRADRASARCWMGCSRMSAGGTVPCSSSVAKRVSASRRCCAMSLSRPPAAGSPRSRASSRRWSWPTRDCTSCARRCSTDWMGWRSLSRLPSEWPWVSWPVTLRTASWSRWRRSA